LARWKLIGKPGFHTPFDWPLAAFLITAGVAVWAAFDRQNAWSKLWLILGAVLLYYSFANWAARAGVKALVIQSWMLAFIGTLIAMYFIVSHDWDAYPSKYAAITQVGRAINSAIPDFPFERFHPNVLAGAMAMLVPFSAGSALVSWNENQKRNFAVALALSIITLTGLILSSSRGAWAAVATGVLLVFWWLTIRRITLKRRQRRTLFFTSIAAVLLLLTLLLIIFPGLLDGVLSDLPSLESGLKRADLYRNSLILINDYPFIGAGLNNFMMLYSSYALLLHVGFTTHGHNLYLDLTVEQGIIALFVFLWMLLLIGEAAWRMMYTERASKGSRNPPNDPVDITYNNRSVLLGSAVISILVLILHGVVDDAIYSSRMVLIMFVPFAFAVPELLKARTPSLRQQIRAVLAGLAILALIVVFSWRPIFSLLNSNLAAVRQGQAELSVYSWPDWPVQDSVRREVDLGSAITGYEKALSLNPGNASARRRLGQIKLSTGDYEEALRHLEVAYSQASWDNATRQLLGEAYLMNGRMEEGIRLWSITNNEQRQLDLRSWWYSEVETPEKSDFIRSIAQMYD
jgi:cytochrome c-type biogenesis protein CcmH/NrfG